MGGIRTHPGEGIPCQEFVTPLPAAEKPPSPTAVMSDEAIHAINESLPSTCSAARLALLPDILRDWSALDLRIHLSFLPDRQKAARKQLVRLETLGRQAARLLDGLRALDAGIMTIVMYRIEEQLTGETTEPYKFRAMAAGRRRVVEEWLTALAAEFAGQKRVAKKGTAY